MAPVDALLAKLAHAHGVLTSYDDWSGTRVDVSADTVRAVLEALGVEAGDALSVHRSLENVHARPWLRLSPPTAVLIPTDRSVLLHVPVGVDLSASIQLEVGGWLDLPVSGEVLETRDVAGQRLERRELRLPADLPYGYHWLQVRAGDHTAETRVITVPSSCPTAAELGRVWGWMVQLYAVRSQQSWGIGDYADLAALCRLSGEQGADLVLCNPLHAAAPTMPQVDSPYSPASRRFHSTLYLRAEDIAEASALDARGCNRLARLAADGRALTEGATIDRNSVARLQREAFELVHAVPLESPRAEALAAFVEREGPGLLDFATWCALAEVHGPRWTDWPPDLRHPRSPAVAAARQEQSHLVDLHVWLQWQCDQQRAAAQAAALEAGQRIGIIHDLAVGVSPYGADAWALQDDLAHGMTVGAPPDSFNQRGQDWQLPPWRPDRLAESGYAPFRDMLRSILRHGGGVRIDHALGLFRLYWVPEGRSPAEGTYVRYPAKDLLGVLALEAHRASSIVVAEDLGTVEVGVPEQLAAHGIWGSAVLWFERDAAGTGYARSSDYRADAFASVTTHDLPTAIGFWTGEATRARAELGLLGEGRTVEAQQELDRGDREALQYRLVTDGLVAADASVDELVTAMHVFLGRTPSRLAGVALGDAVGEHRQPNLPGTQHEYPNWRIPLADTSAGTPRPVLLEDLADHAGVRRTVELLRHERPRSPGRSDQD